ncbi:hypothetical protein C0991_005315 [Blastosporella zonata]|nr:hypothetical protein C0991_005315 [Blastosporella zonata]
MLKTLVNAARGELRHKHSYAAPATRLAKNGRRNARIIRTLQVHLLQPCDLIDLSERRHPTITIRDASARLFYERHYQAGFPPNTRGFLYYHQTPDAFRSGQIRFRVIPSDGPCTFSQGKDLFMESRAVPWSLPLTTLVQPNYAPLKSLLLEEGLIDDATIRIPPNRQQRFSINLHSLEQPFVIDLQDMAMNFNVVTEQSFSLVHFTQFWSERRNGVLRNPYSGRLLLRFERSTLLEHSKARILVIRVVKILEPITSVIPDYDMYFPIPQEGELLQKREQGRGNKIGVFNVDLDKPSSSMQGLKLLIIDDTISVPKPHSPYTPESQ